MYFNERTNVFDSILVISLKYKEGIAQIFECMKESLKENNCESMQQIDNLSDAICDTEC